MREPPKDQTRFDPNRNPFKDPAARFTYVEHPIAGKLMVNSDTRVVTPMDDNPYPGHPLKLPPELMEVEQPFIRTCGYPTKGNRGCNAAVGGGCAILQRFGRVGPVNVIVERHGKIDSAPCHIVYCGVSEMGRPTSQGHMLMDGWNILSDRTAIPENILNPKTKILEVRQTEVPDLAPWYETEKVGRFAEVPKEPKRRGRPPKNANRESLAASGS